MSLGNIAGSVAGVLAAYGAGHFFGMWGLLAVGAALTYIFIRQANSEAAAKSVALERAMGVAELARRDDDPGEASH